MCRQFSSQDHNSAGQRFIVGSVGGGSGDFVIDGEIRVEEFVSSSDGERRGVARLMCGCVCRFDRNVGCRHIEVTSRKVDQRAVFVSVFQRHVHFVQHAEFAPRSRLTLAGEDVLRVHVHAQFVHPVQQRFIDLAEAWIVLHRVDQLLVLGPESVEVRAAFVSDERDVPTEFRRVLLGESDVIGLSSQTPRH